MTRFRFRTRFTTTASPDDAFRTIVEPELWVDRWRHVLAVERVGPRDTATPAFEGRVRGPAGYSLAATITTVETDPPHHADQRLEGDLAGTATWRLSPGPDATAVELVMDVTATRAWMIALAPVARPLFEWSHARVVRQAVDAASDSIGARVLRFDSRAEEPSD